MLAVNDIQNPEELIQQVMKLANCSESLASTALLDTKFVVEKAVANIKAGLVNDNWEQSGKKKKSTSTQKPKDKPTQKSPVEQKKEHKSKVVHYTSEARPKPSNQKPSNGRSHESKNFDKNLTGLVFTPSDSRGWNIDIPEEYRRKPERITLDALSDISDFELEIETSIGPTNFISGKVKCIDSCSEEEVVHVKEVKNFEVEDCAPDCEFSGNVTFGKKCIVTVIKGIDGV